MWHGRADQTRSDICLDLGPADRAELQALNGNRNTLRKLVRCANIVLATAGGQGITERLFHLL